MLKTVDRHGWNADMSCPVLPDFWLLLFVNDGPLWSIWMKIRIFFKTKVTDRDRQENVIQTCQNLEIHVSACCTASFPLFWHFFATALMLSNIRSKAYQNLFKIFRRLLKAIFTLFPIKSFWMATNLGTHFSKIGKGSNFHHPIVRSDKRHFVKSFD